jgi:AhpD family alkylhydroperoxidase
MVKPAERNWEEAPPEVREIYEGLLRGELGCVPMLLSRPPEVMRSFLAFYGTVGRTLSRRAYELVYLRVSIVNRCEPCVKVHTAAARQSGVAPQQLVAIERGEYASFETAEQAALKFADKSAREPCELGPPDVEELTAHFSREQIADLDVLVGLANLTSRRSDPKQHE